MFGLGMGEIVLILVIVIVLFGATKLPELGKGVGSAIRNFKKSMNESEEIDVTPPKKVSKDEEEVKKENSA